MIEKIKDLLAERNINELLLHFYSINFSPEVIELQGAVKDNSELFAEMRNHPDFKTRVVEGEGYYFYNLVVGPIHISLEDSDET